MDFKITKIRKYGKGIYCSEKIGVQYYNVVYAHLYPNSNFEVAKKLTGKLTYTPATESVADYTSNQFTAEYHKQVN